MFCFVRTFVAERSHCPGFKPCGPLRSPRHFTFSGAPLGSCPPDSGRAVLSRYGARQGLVPLKTPSDATVAGGPRRARLGPLPCASRRDGGTPVAAVAAPPRFGRSARWAPSLGLRPVACGRPCAAGSPSGAPAPRAEASAPNRCPSSVTLALSPPRTRAARALHSPGPPPHPRGARATLAPTPSGLSNEKGQSSADGVRPTCSRHFTLTG